MKAKFYLTVSLLSVVLFFSFAGVSAATLQDVKNAADALQEQINQFSAAISVTTSPLIPYVSLKINNSTFSTVSVTSGSNYTLAWTTRNVVSCVASGAWSGSVNGSSTSVGIATVNKTFILTCKNSAGKALLSAVTLNVVPVPVIAPTTVVNPTEDFTIPPNPTSCNPNWKCTSWSAVTYIYYPQIRICTDANNCGITSNKPIESRPATVFVDAKKVDLKINGSDTVINALPNTQVYFNWTRPVPATCWGEDYLGISYSSANSLDSESSILTSSSVGLHKYTLVCRNETGDKKQTADSVYVNVTNNISDPLPILPKEPKLSVNIKANNFDTPIIVNPGDTFNLTWTSEGAGKFSGSCKVYAGNEGLINSEISGSRRINVGDLIGWKRYMIVCSDNQGNTEKDIVSVNVSNSSVSTLDVKDPIILTIEHTTPLPAHYVNAVDSVCWHVISSEPQNCSGKDDLLTVNVNKTDTNGCLIFPDKKPTKDKKYTITCNKGNSWNKITDTVTESIVVPATIGGSSSNTSATNKINLKANGLSGTSSIVSGDTVMLTWFFGIPGSAGDLGTCVASGDWSGNKTLAAYSSDTLPSGLADHVFSNVTSNKIYTLTCTNSKTGEVSTDTVNVNIDQNPSVNLTINGGGKLYSPTSSYYVPVQINWNTSPAIRNCLGQALSSAVNWTRDGSNSNYPSPFIFDQHSGAVTENVNSSNIYTVICSNKGKNCIGGDSNCYNGYQSVIDFVGVSVPAIISQPLIQLSANGSYKLPTGTNVTVPMGGNVTLKWVGTNAYNHTCKAYGDWSGAKSDSGTEIISNITSEKTFTLACDSTTTDASDQPCVGNVNSGCRNTIVSVKVSPFGKFTVAPPASIDLKVEGKDSLTVAYGTGINLSWKIGDGSVAGNNFYGNCTASGDWSGSVAPFGTTKKYLMSSRKFTFTLTCNGTGDYKAISKSVTVTVLPQKVTPTINPVSVAGNCDSLSKCWDGSAFIAGQGCVKGFARGGGYGVTCTRYDTANDDDSVGVNGVAFCGNGWCDGSETISSCPTDCKVSNYKVCGVWQDCIDKSAIFMKDTKDCSLLDDAQNSLISPAKYKTQTVCCGDKNIFGNCSKRELLKDAYATPIETSIGTVNIKANNSDGSVAVASGSSVTLNWESKNALYDTCTASGDWVGEKSNSGSETIQNITSSKTFSIDCHNSNDTVLVNVNSSTSSTIQDLTAKLNSLQQQLNALNESASIKIKYPNGGEALAVGKTYSITWNSFKVGNVNIDLLSGQTGTLATVVRIATNISASTGSFAWKVPTTVTKGNKFKIRIKGVNTTSSSVGFQDDSDGYFSIIQ